MGVRRRLTTGVAGVVRRSALLGALAGSVFSCFAAVTKSVDVADLKSVGANHAGSSPASGTMSRRALRVRRDF